MNASPMPGNRRGFVLCADDYAMTPGVSAGILALLEAGHISATGAMTNRPFWRVGARDLAPLHGKADLGVHLTLTCGEPLSDAPHLARSGRFPTLGALVLGVQSGRIPLSEIESEIAAQLAAFEEEMGVAPDFIDGHQHVHGMPGVREAVLRVIGARYPDRQPYLRDASERWSALLARGSYPVKALGVSVLSAPFGVKARALGFATNQGFSGFSGFDPLQDYAADFAHYLAHPGQKPLIMCHPGFVDAELRALDPAVESRPREIAFFRSSQFEDLCAAAGMAPTRMKDL